MRMRGGLNSEKDYESRKVQESSSFKASALRAGGGTPPPSLHRPPRERATRALLSDSHASRAHYRHPKKKSWVRAWKEDTKYCVLARKMYTEEASL